MSYQHPGLVAVSEFARQQSGAYLHGTCVEASTLMIGMATQRLLIAPALIGDYLQTMVSLWRAHNPGVSPDGSSSYQDASWWMGSQWGLTVDANLGLDAAGAVVEMQANIPHGYLYLVGTCNAAALPGDEPGVQCHGFMAGGVTDDGGIICGDPDNALAQANMPANPEGMTVAYHLADFERAGVTSLTRVHPMPTAYDRYFNALSGQDWQLKATPDVHLRMGLLTYWQALGGLPGLPLENEQYTLQAAAPGSAFQRCERGVLVYDPERLLDNPPTPGPCYLAHIDDTRFGAAAPKPEPAQLVVNGGAPVTVQKIEVTYG